MTTIGTGLFGSGTIGDPRTPSGTLPTKTVTDRAGSTDQAGRQAVIRRTLTDSVNVTDRTAPSGRRVQVFSDNTGGPDTYTTTTGTMVRIVLADGVDSADTFTTATARDTDRARHLFGNVEAAAIAVFRADPELSEVPASTGMVGYSAGRWLRVVRTGGMPTLWMRLDNPVLSIAAYADDKSDALDLAWAARAAIHAARGRYVGNGLAIYDVLDAEGFTWSPDDHNPDAARYEFKLALVTKPMAVS